MFLPPEPYNENSSQSCSQTKVEKKQKQQVFDRIEYFVRNIFPFESLELTPSDIQVQVHEFQCGDPNCSPVDTAIGIFFLCDNPNDGADGRGRGMFSLPIEATLITEHDIENVFPTLEILQKWKNGEETPWSPTYHDEYYKNENVNKQKGKCLRFSVGQRVQCRVGPDPVKGWKNGTIVQLWYREQSWPKDTVAPYKIVLDDNEEEIFENQPVDKKRMIFAPGDMDQIIRLLKK